MCLNLLLLFIPTLIGSTYSTALKLQQNDYQIAFEWAELARYNKRYVKYSDLHTFKYNRTTSAMNATYTFNIDVGNEWELIVQAYKFASNEYRSFPLRFEVNMCAAVNDNYFGLDRVNKCGNFSCPIKKEIRYHYCNWAIDESQFPPLIPNGKYKLEIQALYHDEEMYIQNYYGTVSRGIGMH